MLILMRILIFSTTINLISGFFLNDNGLLGIVYNIIANGFFLLFFLGFIKGLKKEEKKTIKTEFKSKHFKWAIVFTIVYPIVLLGPLVAVMTDQLTEVIISNIIIGITYTSAFIMIFFGYNKEQKKIKKEEELEKEKAIIYSHENFSGLTKKELDSNLEFLSEVLFILNGFEVWEVENVHSEEDEDKWNNEVLERFKVLLEEKYKLDDKALSDL